MKPYNLDEACPKCGHEKIRSYHYPANKRNASGFQYEHFLRWCPQCRHEWLEACKKGVVAILNRVLKSPRLGR